MFTERLNADDGGIARAVALLRDGQPVAIPTETVYGLAADARNDQAVAAIYAAKDRPSFNPLIVHVPDFDAAQDIALPNDLAATLAQAFWPGPLTLVLPLRDGAGLSGLVTAGLPTVGLRAPAHPLAQRVLRDSGLALAAPSANPSGKISPTSADHVLAGLSGRIPAVLDGGMAACGVESTIVGFEGDQVVLLRPGGVAVEDIAALGIAVRDRTKGETITAPGQLASHYAPDAQLRLGVEQPTADELWLGFGPQAVDADLNLSAKGDLAEAAARLFAALHQMDARAQGRRIAVSPIPETGLGLAINDRLRRAAAPRDQARPPSADSITGSKPSA